MPGWNWGSETIVDDLSDVACFRYLLLKELRAIAAETGHTFKIDPALEDAIIRCANRYRHMLQLRNGQRGIGADGPVFAVKAMYRFFHEEFINPNFKMKKRVRGPTDDFAKHLFSISPRGLVAHNFCLRFLKIVGWRYFRNNPLDSDIVEFNALIEETVRNFEGRTNYSFDQLYTRVFHGVTLR